MSERPHKLRGPIGVLIEAIRDYPIVAILLGIGLLATGLYALLMPAIRR